MHLHHKSTVRFLMRSAAVIGLLTAATGAMAQEVPIVQPGAPGQAPRALTAEEAARIADTRFSVDDVKFMQDMIWHHHQAVQMAELVEGRTTRREILDAAGRIKASQAGEITFMQNWLRQRGQEAPNPAQGMAHHAAGHAGAGGHDHSTMAGMATPEQMAALAAAQGPAFERLFLERMIAHHQGALTMARGLLRQAGSAFDPTLYEFTNEVISEQQAEITRMSAVLVDVSDDPRSTLRPGFADAGQAIRNLALVASLPKPTGFFDPNNPTGGPITKDEQPTPAGATPATAPFTGRAPLLSFSNTDMAFSGNMLAVGSYHGFNLYRLGQDGAAPRLLSSVICPGGQGDLSIVGNILIMSVEQNRGRVDCGRQGVSEDVSPDRFRGLRIFDISNPAAPRQVGLVQTCRGSHTHSVVSESNGSIIVYVSGTAGVRSERELPGCVGEAGGDRTALFSIDVVEIPINNPSASRIIDSPRVFADPASGRIAGLWQGGTHGEGTQQTSRTDQCHDITTFPSRNLAAGACSGNGIILDISDPRKPVRLDAVVDPGFAYWHSATFNNDGTKVLFTDEWGGGGQARCQAQDPKNWGANAIYDIVDRRLRFRNHYKLPAAQSQHENCVAHNGSIVPVPGRDIFVQAWYQGGISVIDFTDSANPVEIAYFDRGPLSTDYPVTGGFWSAYWYNGNIYGTEIVRGLDVLALQPSEHLTANEIAAARLASQGDRFNPQQQFPVTWPADPMIARAYVDQLQRSGALAPRTIAQLNQVLGQAGTRLASNGKDARLAGRLASLATSLRATRDDAIATRRTTALRETLTGIAARLR